MKTVGILIGYHGNSIDRKELYIKPSIVLQRTFEKYRLKLIRVSYNHVMKNGYFNNCYSYDNDDSLYRITKKAKPDILRQRTDTGKLFVYNKLSDIYKIIPDYKIIALAGDKYETYLHLKKFMPKTTLLSSFFGSSTARDGLGSNLVLKPIRGSGGIGISFIKKSELIKKQNKYEGLGSLYIVQNFKDFGKGYNQTIKGNHDFRIVFVGNKISFCIIRTPAKGSLKSNIASGGSQTSVDLTKIPKELISITKKIRKILSIDNDNLYSLDFAYCKDDKRWYLLEMNFSPGIRFPPKDKKRETKYFNDLAVFFKKLIAKKR